MLRLKFRENKLTQSLECKMLYFQEANKQVKIDLKWIADFSHNSSELISISHPLSSISLLSLLHLLTEYISLHGLLVTNNHNQNSESKGWFFCILSSVFVAYFSRGFPEMDA